jgi:16S rRNA (guanine527-N7)-methyltransferase
MPTLSEPVIADLLAPYLPDLPAALLPKFSAYLNLLLKWNARTNLTAIRDPEEIVRRHFGESLFAASHLPLESDSEEPNEKTDHRNPEASGTGAVTLLDLGSGAGFPGLPIALLRPGVQVTLAESQNKKAAFLREAVRTLGVPNAEVWAGRAEALPAGRQFRGVTLRAVDNMEAALAAATARIVPGGFLALLTTVQQVPGDGRSIPLPNSQTGILYLRCF